MSKQSASGSPGSELAWGDLRPILEKLRDQLSDKSVILVGGQALNFWQSRYASTPELRGTPPLTSKDIDFCGDRNAVSIFAARLGGRALFPSFGDATPSTGMVFFADSAGTERKIDFIDQPHGLTVKEVANTAIRAELEEDDGTPSGLSIWVMHPIRCMISRVCNTMDLPGYSTPHALLQLRLSVVCSRAFLQELLGSGKDGASAVTDLAERIFHFCHDEDTGRRVKKEFGIDPFEAIPIEDLRLPEKFRTLRFPQMQQWLEARRSRATGHDDPR